MISLVAPCLYVFPFLSQLQDKSTYLLNLLSDSESGSPHTTFSVGQKPCEIKAIMFTLDMQWID